MKSCERFVREAHENVKELLTTIVKNRDHLKWHDIQPHGMAWIRIPDQTLSNVRRGLAMGWISVADYESTSACQGRIEAAEGTLKRVIKARADNVPMDSVVPSYLVDWLISELKPLVNNWPWTVATARRKRGLTRAWYG